MITNSLQNSQPEVLSFTTAAGYSPLDLINDLILCECVRVGGGGGPPGGRGSNPSETRSLITKRCDFKFTSDPSCVPGLGAPVFLLHYSPSRGASLAATPPPPRAPGDKYFVSVAGFFFFKLPLCVWIIYKDGRHDSSAKGKPKRLDRP